MPAYAELAHEALESTRDALTRKYESLKAKGLALNMARGKPSRAQLDLSMPMLTCIVDVDDCTAEDGTDCRNYGVLDGIPEAKRLMAVMLDDDAEHVVVFGNSSLNIMYDTMARCWMFGTLGHMPWCKLDEVKWLCPCPGYDRHFGVTEAFGIKMIPVAMNEDGPDMDEVERLVAEDASIKGIWCVPQYSNPDGYTYSDETIERFAKMKTAAPDFKIFWDEAYIVHHLTDEIIETPVLLNECKKYGTQDRVFMFTSTSKITFPGAGVSAIACSENSMKYMCKRFSVMIISYDKMNQLRHVRFLKNKEGVLAHMAKHRRRLVPCFDAVKTAFTEELTPCGNIAHWTNPKGGYFISLYVMPGCAKRVAALCKECGLTLTGAGSAYPYHKDPEDSHLRIAPTYPSLDEVETASDLLCVCVKLATVEKLLAEKA